MMGSTNDAEGSKRLLRGECATGEFTESRYSPDGDRLLDSNLPTLATTPHTPPLRHGLEDHDHDRGHIPASGSREYAPNMDRANQIGVQQPQHNLDSAYSGRTSGSANTRFYLLDTESSAPDSRKTILWSIDPEHLIYNIWLIESFTKFIQSFYPPPARIGKYTLNFIVMDSEFPNENSLQMLPREFVSYLVKEPYNPTVEFQGKCGHVLTLPTLNMGSGRMGKRLRVVYMIEYDPPDFEGPQTPQYDLRPYENEVPALSRAPVQLNYPQRMQELDHSRAVHSCPLYKNQKYMAVITVHILLTDDRLEKRVLRPPFDIDIEEQGNFSELYTKVEALISDAYSVSAQGKLSEIVGSRAVEVHLAYNTFVLPRHFAWNEKSFTEFDAHEKGGAWKLHLVAWIVEHPLGDPEGAPTGLPLPRVTIDRLGNGWATPAPLDLREWKAKGDDTSGFQSSRKAKEPDRRLRPNSPSQGSEYSALSRDFSSEPGSHTSPHATYQAWPWFSREPSLPPRPVEIGDPIDGRPWQSTNCGWGQEMKPGWCHKPKGKTRAPSWQAYTEEHREDEDERRRAESYLEDFYIDKAPVRNDGPHHGTVQYYRGPDHGPVAEHGPGGVWKHYGVAGEHKPETDYWRPESAGSVASDHSGSQDHSSRGVSEHRPAEGLHMGQSRGGLDHAGRHPGTQAYNVNFTAQPGHDTDQLEARSSPVKRKREE